MSSQEQVRKKENGIMSGMIWAFAERIGAQLVSTIVGIVLARLLLPEAYGIVAIVTVLITFLNIFVTGGFNSALVQKKEADEKDFNTAFILSFSLSGILYALLYILAPIIAEFYAMPELSAVIRVMGLRLPLASINSIQQAFIQRAMMFSRFFWATLIGTIISGVVGIILAVNGFGVWSLVVQYLTNTTIDTIMLFFVCGWRPKFQFSKSKAKEIWGFSWKVLATQMVYTLEGDVRSIIVGKVFGPADLAYYDQGKKYPSLLVSNISTTIDKVMLPAYSKHQDEKKQLKEMIRKSVRLGIYLLMPVLIGFAVVAESFVSIILTDKWLFAVPYIQIFCLSYLTRPLESSLHQALLAIGKSNIVLICMIAINGTGLGLVFVSVFILKSVFSIALFSLLTTFISYTVFTLATRHYIGYGIREQLQDILPSAIITIAMGGTVYALNWLPFAPFLVLIIQIAVGALEYIVLSHICKLKPFEYIKGLLKAKVFKKKVDNCN